MRREPKRLFVTGATGLLGAALVDSWAERWETTALVARSRIRRAGVVNVAGDLNAPETLSAVVQDARPDVVVHCAAWTDLDACEAEPARARVLHRDASAALAEGAAKVGAAFVYVSTDSLFSGTPGPHREDSPIDPRSVYARTKREGEEASLAACARTLVARTCIVGWNAQPKIGLAEWMLRELRAGREIKAFTDVSFTPILTTTFARAVERLVLADVRGIVHVSGRECVSKYDFAVKLARTFGLPEQLVLPSSIRDVALRAPRPASPCLDSSRCERLTGERLPTVDDTLREMREQEANGWRDRLRASIET